MCGNVDQGTVAKRNLVYDSNQRCLVIHGSHNVTIEENVGYENFGHCYLLEDGAEIDNKFIGNFGARTKNMDINPPLRGGIDDDHKSSTFWCTNPINTWIGNVAAGGDDTGFWFELFRDVRSPSVAVVDGPMNELPLTKFQDNIAHSYRQKGLSTYEHGYRPKVRARFENTWAYKNKIDGIFFHNSWNLGVYGGLVADNRNQIRIHRADNVDVEDVTVIGHTDLHQKAIERQGRSGLCPSTYSSIYGITIHSFLFNDRTNDRGPKLKNIAFSNISDTSGCSGTAAIAVHHDEVEPSFDSWTKFESLSIDSTVDTKFSMCKAIEQYVSNVLIEVVDSSMFGQPGFFVSDGQPELTAFTDPSKCSLDEDACLLFCQNTCFDIVRLLVEPDQSYGMTMVVERVGDGMTATYQDGGLTGYDYTSVDTHRTFTAALTEGHYIIKFMKDGQETWPTYAYEQRVETPDCMAGKTVTIEFSKPTPTAAECNTLVSSLVHNGDVETGTTDFWKHRYANFELISGGVQPGSYAVKSKSNNRMRIGQYMDSRCINAGDQYEITARVRFVDGNGQTIACNTNSDGGDRCSYATVFNDYYDETEGKVKSQYERGGNAIDTVTDDGWQYIHGLYTVSANMALGNRPFLYVEYAKGYAEVDQLVIKKPDLTNQPVILNGDFEIGDHRFWRRDYGRSLSMVSPGADNSQVALKTSVGGYLRQYLVQPSLTAGDRYLITAKFKVEGGSGTCDANLWWGDTACPKTIIYSSFFDDSIEAEWKGYKYTAAPYVPGGWNTIWGYVTITEKQATADSIRFEISNGPKDGSLVVDNISMIPAPSTCGSLIVNGGAQNADARGWSGRSAEITVTEDGSDGYALVAFNRGNSWSGLIQQLDTNCMVEGNSYQISAKIKMVNESTGAPHGCTKGTNWGDEACPVIGFYGRVPDADDVYRNVYNTITDAWVADSYNDYSAVFTIPPELTNIQASMYIERPPAGIALHVDDLTVTLI